MKTDLATTVVTSIVGIIAAFFICKLLLPALDDVTVRTINAGAAYTLVDPDPEIFNYRAINPTVEVYVGQCAEYDENGECIEVTEEFEQSEEEISPSPDTQPEEETNPNPDTQPEQNEGDQNGASD